jgi:hypothetical protein
MNRELMWDPRARRTQDGFVHISVPGVGEGVICDDAAAALRDQLDVALSMPAPFIVDDSYIPPSRL